jgi:TRAP-type mannitol/chloroaromatic compound transport system permease small subunit
MPALSMSVPWMIVSGMSLLCLLSCLTVGPIRTSNAIKWVLEKIAHTTGWCLMILMCVTCMDIVFRKLQLPIALTQFQEMEWHLHTLIFSGWMGFNYTETLGFRAKAWIELLGILFLALPFIMVMLEHGWPWVQQSYLQNEASENVTGLPYRWAIKGAFFIGIWLVFLGILSVFLRLIAFLFLGRSAEEADIQIGHSEMEA